jgi:prolyl-tRNA editing enzyme YbaK/EbsC (Cys-tRNA(Pro) deacylase)
VEVASRKGVALDIRTFAGSTRTVEDAALAADADQGQIVRVVVYVSPRPEGRLSPIVCLVSGPNQIDPSHLAAVMGESNVRRASALEVQELVGFTSDDAPPIGYRRDIRVVMDQDLGRYEWIWAATGADNQLFRVTPGVLRMLANAVVSPVAERPWVTPAAAVIARPALQFEAGSAR